MWTRALFLVLLPVLSLPLAAAARGPDKLNAAIEELRGKIGGGADSIATALRRYSQLEVAEEFDIYGRHRMHQTLLKALEERTGPAVAQVATTFLKASTDSSFAAKVLLMKALRAKDLPLPREKRIALLVGMTERTTWRLSVWAVRVLADSGWPEAIDALIGIMAREETSGAAVSPLWNVVSADLYRLLGKEAPQGAKSGSIAGAWERIGKKLPKDPDYRLTGGGGRTISFFGDMISPRSVLAIDHSTSMLQEATLAGPGGHGTVVKGDEKREGPREKKVAIVKRELEQCLQRLRPEYSFNILGYNATVYPWRSPPKLEPANSTNIQSASRFARELDVKQGTNIFETLKLALPIGDVETVYLLSDGVPSVGGNPGEIERLVQAMNYLRGVRIITYGFAAEGTGDFDEDFMKRLASRNWGWYRRLNR